MDLQATSLAVHPDTPGDDEPVDKAPRADDLDLGEGCEDRPKPLPPIICSTDGDLVGCVEDGEKVAAARRIVTVGAILADGAKIVDAAGAEDVHLCTIRVDLRHKSAGEVFKMRPIHRWW